LTPVYGFDIVTKDKVSLDDMWKVIEEFGIKRETLEKTYPSIEVIKELYNGIVQKNEERRKEKSRLTLES
jgi:hypothetical protein